MVVDFAVECQMGMAKVFWICVDDAKFTTEKVFFGFKKIYMGTFNTHR